MSSDIEIMERQVAALFTHDERGRLNRVNVPGGGDAPRFFLGRTIAGSIWRFRFDLDDKLEEQLEELCRNEPAGDLVREPKHLPEYIRLLEGQKVENGPAYIFTETILLPSRETVLVTDANTDVLHGKLEEWLPDVAQGYTLAAVLEDGRAVSVCGSVRITPECHEAGVETLVSHRGKGFAVDATAAWANEIRRTGFMPLYSTSWENTSSQRVAEKLGLRMYGVDFHVT